MGQEPGRFFITVSIRGEHEEVGFRWIIQIQLAFALRRNSAQIPTRGMNSNDFASGLESAGFGEVPFAVRPATEAQEPAVWRPVHVVDLVGFVFDSQTPVTDRWFLGVKIDWRGGNFVVASAPGDLFPIRTQAGSAARDVQVDDIRPMRLNQQYAMFDPHTGMNGGNNPLPVARPTGIV
jgi:hypothetical protein